MCSGELEEGKPNLQGRTKDGSQRTYRLTLELTFKKFQEVWMRVWETIQKGAAETKKQRYETANQNCMHTACAYWLVSERSDLPEHEAEFVLSIAFSLKCVKC